MKLPTSLTICYINKSCSTLSTRRRLVQRLLKIHTAFPIQMGVLARQKTSYSTFFCEQLIIENKGRLVQQPLVKEVNCLCFFFLKNWKATIVLKKWSVQQLHIRKCLVHRLLKNSKSLPSLNGCVWLGKKLPIKKLFVCNVYSEIGLVSLASCSSKIVKLVMHLL